MFIVGFVVSCAVVDIGVIVDWTSTDIRISLITLSASKKYQALHTS